MVVEKNKKPSDEESTDDEEQLTAEEMAELQAEIGVEPDNPADAEADDDDSNEKDKPEESPESDDEDKDDDEAPDDAGSEEDDDDEESDDADDGDDSETVEGLTLADLEEAGLGKFKDVETARKSLKNLRTALSRRDEDALIGRQIRSAREAGMDPAALFQSGDRKKDPARSRKGGAPEYNPEWERQVKPKYDDEGNQIGFDGPAELVAEYEAFESHRQDLWKRIYRGDPEAMNEAFGDVIEQRAQAIAAQTAGKTAMDAFMEKNGDFLLDHEEEFEDLMNKGASPEIAVELLEARHGRKKTDDDDADDKDDDDKGDKAKNADLEKLKKRTRGKARKPAKAPKRNDDDLDLDNMDEEDIAKLAVKRAGIEL